ncbi:alpha/beta fold hydrolase [Pseudonocardia kujensis]|uniref:alpha/beta fold hydrolase n=1 Tax=Pseudonocardia kujensis TaxID=1128675 RepID=UPI001E395286|nr:alpha/beta hydrolase [Pseudonocardia kujensis]MCE0763551.1 alpha/beta fold hydrolase [Pseudonocardia kujensis]
MSTTTPSIESVFVDAPGLRIHALAAGTEQPGTPIVLVHGFPQTSHCFRHQLPALAAAGHPAYAVDTRGFGRTDKPGTRVSRAMLAADVVAFCAALDLRDVLLVGHDWGGLIAFKAAIDHPDLFTRLALLDSNTTVITTDIPHPYWFKVEPLPEAFLAAHARDMIEVRLGGKDGTVLGGRPGNPWAVKTGTRPLPAHLTEADLAHYADSFDEASQQAAIQYYRYAMPIHRVIADPATPSGERYVPLSEREIASMWLHPEGFEQHPLAAEAHDIGPEDRQKIYDRPALFVFGNQQVARFPELAGLPKPSGHPFVDQYVRYFPDLRAVQADCGHYVPEEAPELVNAELLALLDR